MNCKVAAPLSSALVSALPIVSVSYCANAADSREFTVGRPNYHRNVGKTESSVASIEERIETVRGHRVLFDADLANLYGVSTKRLLESVRRNLVRFPADFMLRLTVQEVTTLRSQFATSKRTGRGGRRHAPYAFTEQGVAMLSSVLRSPAAITVNIEIMRAFVRLRRASLVSQQLSALIADLSKRVDSHDAAIKGLIETIRRLVEAPTQSRKRPIGFVPIE